MKSMLLSLLRVLGIWRPRPKTKMGLVFRRFERGGIVIGVLYLALHLFPQVLFAHRITVDGITMYSREEPGQMAEVSLKRSAGLLQRSELMTADFEREVFVCGSKRLYQVFGPGKGGSFAISMPVTDHCFVAAVDGKWGKARQFGKNNVERSFPGVVAHEFTHGLIRNRIGLWRSYGLPMWIEEGYCEYVAGDGSFPEKGGIELFLSGEGEGLNSYRYFEARKMITYLIEGRGMKFEEIVDGDLVFEEVREAARAWYSERRELAK